MTIWCRDSLTITSEMMDLVQVNDNFHGVKFLSIIRGLWFTLQFCKIVRVWGMAHMALMRPNISIMICSERKKN